jgi:transposase
VRVTTALNRLLALRGASVTGVRLTADGVVVRVRLRRRRIACSVCGQVYTGMHDRDVRRWRHLDLGRHRCFLEYELRRVDCGDCGVRVEAVPRARRGARHTREFEDLVAFCAQRMAKSQVQSLLRVAWDTVGRIIERVVADRLDDRRLEGLIQIGVDEISYRRGRRYLTNVADHQTGGIVWSAPGRSGRTLAEFFELLGERKHSIRAVSIDMSEPYAGAIRTWLPEAEIAFDPFHVVALAGAAVDEVRLREWQTRGHSVTPGRDVDQAHPLGAAQSPREAHRPPTLSARRDPADQPAALPRLPTQGTTPRPLPTQGSTPGTRASRRLDRLGSALQTQTVRAARPHPTSPPRRDPRRDPPRAHQRPPRGACTTRSGSSATAATASTHPKP